MEPIGLLRLFKRPVTDLFAPGAEARGTTGTGGGRARAPSCCCGLDMAGRREGGWRERGRGRTGSDGQRDGAEEGRYKAVASKIGAQDQFKFAQTRVHYAMTSLYWGSKHTLI